VQVAAGEQFSLAIAANGELSSWGYDGFGQSATPAGNFVTIAAGKDHTATVGVLAADINCDGTIDGADLGMLLAAWGTPAGDCNHDGTTDGGDLGILLVDWPTI
jgi:hypothetical protein